MSKKKRFETIIVKKERGTQWITLNRPHRMNLFNLEMIQELSTAIDEAEADDEVRSIVFIGGGDRAFSAGADFVLFSDMNPESAVDKIEKGQNLMNKIEASSKPTIAAIHGYCLGGGLELSLACDFRIADETAVMGTPEILRGIIPGWGGTQRLCRTVGLARAKEMVLIGDRLKAEEALESGLIHKMVPVDKLGDEAAALASRLAEGPPIAIKFAKQALNQGSQLPLKEGLKYEVQAFKVLSTTEDVIEGISSFFEKRKPEFKGK
jgi:enoyl-CoA hydratase/3-hydroxyacyl-CoA dehydrogenase